MMKRLEKIRHILVCPLCGEALEFRSDGLRCEKCEVVYPIRNGKVYFSELPERDDEFDMIKGCLKRWLGKYYYSFGVKIIAPDYPFNLRRKIYQFLDPSKQIVIDAGCGNQRIDEEIICIDLFDYEEVDVVCDLGMLPFKQGSVDAFISQSVLEHVKEPGRVVSGFARCTKKDGLSLHLVPFMYPFHSSPNDYQRYTHKGIRVLFEGFDVVDQVTATGPFTLILVNIIEFFSILLSLGHERLRGYIYLALCTILFPFKFLDYPFVNGKKFLSLAPTILTIFRKQS